LIHRNRNDPRSMTFRPCRLHRPPFAEDAEMFWIGMTIGFMSGGTLGILAMGMAAVAGEADRRAGLK